MKIIIIWLGLIVLLVGVFLASNNDVKNVPEQQYKEIDYSQENATDSRRKWRWLRHATGNVSTRRVNDNRVRQMTFEQIWSNILSNSHAISNSVFDFEQLNDINLQNDSMVVEIKIDQKGDVVLARIIETNIENAEFKFWFLNEVKTWQFGELDSAQIPDGFAHIQHTFYFGRFEFSEARREAWRRARENSQ